MTFHAPIAAPALHRRHARAIVIGSGFGGLAAAIRLGALGYRVTILERLDQPGGRASVFREGGFTFDGGPTIITAPFLLEELWTLAGRRLSDDVDLRLMDPFYRIRFQDGMTFDTTADPEAMRAEVAKFSHSDVDGYDRFIRASEENYLIGFEDLGQKTFSSFADMAKALPDLILKLRAYRTVHGFVSEYVKDERIRQALSFHPLFIGGNPYWVPSVFVLIQYLERRWGVHFAMGGTGALVRAMVALAESQGATLRLNADVAEITTDGETATGVRLNDGETIAADIVVSNADASWTYRNMLPSLKRRRWTAPRIDRMRYSMSLFVWYFGTKRRYPDVPHHTILMGPRYKELLKDIFERKVLADDFSLYLHRPTHTDPSLAPPGHDAFYVLSPVPNLDADVDWSVEAEPYRKRVAKVLSETVLPDLEANVVASKVMVPPDFRDRYLAHKGAAFGIEPVLWQSAWFRPHNVSENVKNLFLVGAGTHPGAGVPGVISSARLLDRRVPDAASFV
jgi:phytoene desaturase